MQEHNVTFQYFNEEKQFKFITVIAFFYLIINILQFFKDIS